MANKFLKKMGTKERFRHPQSEDAGFAPDGSNPAGHARPAYSPDVFDASPKKGSKLAQRLLGKTPNSNSSRLQYGSHVAGRLHHRWSDSLETAGFEPSATAAEVQRVRPSDMHLRLGCNNIVKVGVTCAMILHPRYSMNSSN